MVRMLRTGEISKITGFGGSSLRRWARAAKIPSFRPGGGQFFFDLFELADALEMDSAALEKIAVDMGIIVPEEENNE